MAFAQQPKLGDFWGYIGQGGVHPPQRPVVSRTSHRQLPVVFFPIGKQSGYTRPTLDLMFA